MDKVKDDIDKALFYVHQTVEKMCIRDRDNKAAEFSFQDPIHAYWLKTEYFAKQS